VAIFDLRRKPFHQFSGCSSLRCRNDWLNGLGFVIGLYLNNLFPKTEIRATNLSSAYRTCETLCGDEGWSKRRNPMGRGIAADFFI
jgi:hypothetical protein